EALHRIGPADADAGRPSVFRWVGLERSCLIDVELLQSRNSVPRCGAVGLSGPEQCQFSEVRTHVEQNVDGGAFDFQGIESRRTHQALGHSWKIPDGQPAQSKI